MKKRALKLTAMLLTAAIMTQSLSSVAFAADQSQSSASSQTNGSYVWGQPGFPETERSGLESARILSEVDEKRTETSKTFLMEDGTYLLASYEEPIHYKDRGGKWQDIDNTLDASDAVKAEAGPVLQNRAGRIGFQFFEADGQKNAVSINAENAPVSWRIDGAAAVAKADAAPETAERAADSDSVQAYNDRFLKLKKLNQKITYQDALPNIDVQYVLSSDSVKENIILKTKDAQKQFTETYQIGKLVAVQKDDQTIELFREEDAKRAKPVYTINAPQMSDANGEASASLSIRILKQNSGTLQIAVSPDEAWLNDPNRAYPVVIDPTVGSSRRVARDTFISSGYPTQNFREMGSMYLGNETAAYKTCRILVNFDLPVLSKGDMVVQAQLNLTQHQSGMNPSTASMQVNAYEMKTAWNESTATWSNSKAATDTAKSGRLLDYFNASQSTNGKCSAWDITRLVKNWYSGASANNGIVLIANDEPAVVRNQYITSENPDANGMYPGMVVRYVNNNGLEEYWGYHSQSAGRAGTGSVNDYTGNLAFSTPVMNTTGERVPLEFSLQYNGYLSGSHFADGQKGAIYGWGWQSNLSQRVDPTNPALGSNYKYVYTDEDGTNHYFIVDPSDSSKIIDEDGLGLEITTGGPTDEYFTIKSSDGSKKTFTQTGYLRKIYDSNNNSLTLSYGGANLTTITDAAGRVSTIAYSGTTNRAVSIAGPDGKKTQFGYSGEKLASITYPDGKSVQFTYDSDNRLQKAANVDGSWIQYAYHGTGASDPMVKNRVKEAAEYSTAGAVGNKVTFSYNPDNTTTFQYFKAGQAADQAPKETVQFDFFGRATSVINADNSASSSAYTSQSTKNGSANKMTSQASTSAPVINILKDSNAELNNGSWVGSNWSTPGGVFSLDGTSAYLGTKSLKVTQNQTNPARSGFSQQVMLSSGTYTFSAYAKTNNVSGGMGANLYIAFFNGTTHTSTLSGSGIQGTQDWQRISVTFTVPANVTSFYVHTGLSYANGTAWFDCMQLETGSVANQYNLLENSDFRYSTNNMPNQWSTSSFVSGDGMSGGWVRVSGNPAANKNFYQSVYINKPAASVAFSVSGKSKGTSVPTGKDKRYYAIDLGIAFSDGTVQWNVADFNPDTTGEQYASATFSPSAENQGKTIASVAYYIIYYKNANEAVFKDLQLNIDCSQVNYTYDAKGNLTGTSQIGEGKDTYAYTSANEVSGVTEADGDGYSYTYDSANAHRIKSSRSNQTGMGMYYTYDAFGNMTNTKNGKITAAGAFDSASPYLETAQGYSTNGSYVTSVTDERGKITSYNVDSTTGLTNSVTDPKGNATNYTYNQQNNLLTGVSAQSSAGTVQNAYGYDAADRLNKITHNGFDYTFARDGFGNTTGILVGTQNLITNAFASGNGNLLSSTFGNGFKLGYAYDKYDRVTSVTKNDAAAYQYQYDARGNLAKIVDKTSGSEVTSELTYDLNDRLIKKVYGDGNTIRYTFDSTGRPSGSSYSFAGQSKGTSYTYGSDDRKGDVTLPSGGKVTRSYDALNREYLTNVNPTAGQDPTLRAERSYVNVSGNRTSSLVDTYSNYKRVSGVNTTLSQYRYTYDDNGNIRTVTDKDGKVTTYTYDALNQLTRADDQKANVSTTYSYDVGGNIKEVKTYAYTTGTPGTATGSVGYAYGNANWKDLLTTYNGQNITYDAIGNPLSYRDGMSFTWEGRQLKTAAANGKSISYSYDGDGIRTGKTVAGVTTSYFLDGSTILAQKTGSDVLWFLYDSDGARVGFTYNGTAYYYTQNAQGDVTGIVDSSCNTVVEYSYDAWGKLLGTTGSLASTIGAANPFRYRGYYYDVETGLYYLNSRYYDPQTGRFLSADDTDVLQLTKEKLLGLNLFAYCMNNPVINEDPNGYFVQAIVGAIFGAAIAAVTYWIEYKLGIRRWNTWHLAGYIALSAALGAIGGYVRGWAKFAYLAKHARGIRITNRAIYQLIIWGSRGITFAINSVAKSFTKRPRENWWTATKRWFRW